MIWLQRLRSMASWLFRRSAAERRLDDELRTFVEMSTAAAIRDGQPAPEARRLALIELGGLEQAKEQVRTGRHGASLDEAGQNVRYAFRGLIRNPGFTAVVVLTLAFGIGANTAIFSIIDSLLLRPLAVRNPSELALLTNEDPDGGQESWTYPIWEQLRARRDAFGGVAAWTTTEASFNLAEGGEMNVVNGVWASGELFEVLGVPAALGRTFSPSDDVRGGGPNGPVAVISHGFWQRHFGGAEDVIGRTLTLERIAFTVIGVTAKGFDGLNRGRAFDVALPFGAEPLIRGEKDSRLSMSNSWWVWVLVRRKPDQTIEQAAAALRRLQPAIRDTTQPPGIGALERDDYLKAPFALDPDAAGQSSLRENYRQPLTVMLVVVGLVLLIACANIANLTLARASARSHEWSLRRALGASRARLARQALTESLLLSVIGAGAGLFLANWASRFLVRQLSSDAVSLDLSVDWRVLAFTAGVTIVTALLFGLGPALKASKGAPIAALKEAGRGSSGGRSRIAAGLVVAQVVLSLMLLVGAGLFLRTFASLTGTTLGFDGDRVLMAQISTKRADVLPDQRLDTFERIRQRVLSVPGVEADGLSFIAPLSGRLWYRQVDVSGSGTPQEERNTQPSGVGSTSATLSKTEPYTALNAVTPGWMATFGLSVRGGRDIAGTDHSSAPRVVVVNESFVRKFLPGQNPIGHTVRVLRRGGLMPAREIVGVVTDAVYRNLREDVLPTVYVPLAQFDGDASELPPLDIILSVRAAAGPPERLRKAVADAVTSVNPRLALVFRPLADQVRRTMVQERLLAILSGFFGVLAVLLAAIGLYGVTSYAVSRRKAEIGVRLALGATRGRVMRLVFGNVAVLVGAGTLIGLAATLFVTRYVRTLLFGLEPNDPMTFGAATLLLAAVSFAAGWIPAYRASRLAVTGLLNRS